MTTQHTTDDVGYRVGRAMARDVLADPDMPREWTGIDPQDADQFAAAGLEPGTPEWERQEAIAAAVYSAALASGATCTLSMRDDGGSDETLEFDHEPTRDEIREACREWVEGGEWGVDGASIDVSWTLTDTADDEIGEGSVTVEIEPDHDALIRAAGGDLDCDHDWTSEGEGGCDENPGVWSTGGTSMTFAAHCRMCGLHRTEHHTGSQRDPGEHDTVEYSQPNSWCEECQREECECETVDAE
jgi:hypothetical protein